jgi:CDP-2,3-bis-(O-geranylgeranyl)-sn-glycerol synthase
MHPVLIAKVVILLTTANGTPVAVKRALGNRFSQPIDGGLVFMDGRRLFGPSKTIRGALASVVATTVMASLLGVEASVGALVGTMAIIGDLCSSFVKRRLHFAPSSQAIGLDQLPEALFPALACSSLLPLSALDIGVIVAVFSIGAVILSPVFHRIGLRDRPF